MSGRSVNLTTLFLGRLRPPKRLASTFMHILSPVTDNCPSWISGRRNKSMWLGTEPGTSGSWVRCTTDCATWPGIGLLRMKMEELFPLKYIFMQLGQILSFKNSSSLQANRPYKVIILSKNGRKIWWYTHSPYKLPWLQWEPTSTVTYWQQSVVLAHTISQVHTVLLSYLASLVAVFFFNPMSANHNCSSFFPCFSEKIRHDILCESSARQRIHMKHHDLFSSKDDSKKQEHRMRVPCRKSKKGHNFVKKKRRITSPFDSEQLLWVSSKYLQQ